jgi:hypothetical protein
MQLLAVAVCGVAAVSVTPPLQCSNIEVNGFRYDLSSLNKYTILSSSHHREWKVGTQLPLLFNPCSPINYYNAACPRGSHMCIMDPSKPKVGVANVGSPIELYRNPSSSTIDRHANGR